MDVECFGGYLESITVNSDIKLRLNYGMMLKLAQFHVNHAQNHELTKNCLKQGDMLVKREKVSNIQTYTNNPLAVSNPVQYLTETQVNDLTRAFQEWYDADTRKAQKANRGRYWR